MKLASTAGLMAYALFMQQAAAGWNDAPSFSNSVNTNNNCTVEQKPGFNWDTLPPGDFGKFGGFDFSGFSCKESFQPSGRRRSLKTRQQFQSKCIQGKVGQDKNSSPNFSSGTDDKFSITHMDISVDFDTDMDFIFSMPDGSTCKHTASCKAGGTTVQNKQCGGARSVTFQLPPAGGKKDCNIGIHSIGFNCNFVPPSSSTTTVSSTTTPVQTSTTPTTTTTTSTSVETTTTPQTTTPSSSLTTTTTTTTTKSTTTPSVETTTTPGTTTSPCGEGGGPGCSTTSATTSTPGTTTSNICGEAGGPACSTTPKPCGEEGGPACSTTTTTSIQQTTGTTTRPCGEEGGPACSTTTPKPCGEEGGPLCSTTTQKPCGEEGGPACSTTTPKPCGEEGGPACSTTTPKPCGEQGGPACSTTTSSAQQTPGTTTQPCGENGRPDCSPSTTSAISTTTVPSTLSSVTLPPPTSTTSTSTTTVPDIPPESTAPCPSVLPKCLNTWLTLTSCVSNSEKDCFCPSPEFISNVQDCVASWAADNSEIQAALSYLAGICADFVPQNPGICTGVPSGITLIPTITPIPEAPAPSTEGTPVATGTGIGRGPRPPIPPPTSMPVTTITFTQTISETVVTTAVTVPQVSFVTARPSGSDREGRPADVGLVPAVPAQTTPVNPGEGGSGNVVSTAVATVGEGATTTFSSRPTGTGIIPDTFTGGATKASIGFSIVGGALVVAAFLA